MRQFSEGDWLDEEVRARIQQRVAEQMDGTPPAKPPAPPVREPEPPRTREPAGDPRRVPRASGQTYRNPPRREVPEPPAERRSPRRRTKKKKDRRRVMIPVVAVLAIFLVIAIVHAALVRAPEIVVDEEGTAPALLAANRKPGVYTFLLVGRDDGGGGNTDTIMACMFDTQNGTLDVLSIFRDTMVDVPWDVKKINSVFNRQGIEGLQEQVKKLIGYQPDYYFIMELSVVQELVDCIGGVDFDVPYNMSYDDPTQDLHIHFKQGYQHLNGKETVELLRWRKNNSNTDNSDVGLSLGDVGRVSIQHDVLSALTKQTFRPENLIKIKDLITIVTEKVESDLTYGELLWFGERLLGLESEGTGFYSLPGNYNGSVWSETYHNYQSYVLVNADELRDLVNLHLNPYLVDITADMQGVINGTTENDQIVLPQSSSGNPGAQAAPPAADDENESALGNSATTYQAPPIRETEPERTETNSSSGYQPAVPPAGDSSGGGDAGAENPSPQEPVLPQEPAAVPESPEPYVPAEPGGYTEPASPAESPAEAAPGTLQES